MLYSRYAIRIKALAVILVALVLLVLVTYGPLMGAASRGSTAATVVGALEAALFVVGAGFAGLLALVLLGMKCDESCDENVVPEARSHEWWHTLDAWQWQAQAALALTAFAAAVIAFGFTVARKSRTALACVVLGLAAFCAWALMIAPLGDAFGI
jgi:hypothetical protein